MGKKTKKNVKKGNAETKLKPGVDESTMGTATVSSAGVGETVIKNETKDGAAVNKETFCTTVNTGDERVQNPSGLLEFISCRVNFTKLSHACVFVYGIVCYIMEK